MAGHVNPLGSEAPVVTVDLSRLSRLVSFDETSRLATFGAGVKGPDLEAELRAHGFTLGHFPQSFELSTLGGWIATRSSGQQSLGYGRIERLFAGGRVETPSGRLDLPPFPASAAGPDLRELVLGSEGRLGVITEGTVRVSLDPGARRGPRRLSPRLPVSDGRGPRRRRDAPSALDAPPLDARGDPRRRSSSPVTSGSSAPSRRTSRSAGAREEKCLLLVGISGSENLVRQTRRQVLGALAMRGGVAAGKAFGREWHRNRFRAPYLSNALWEAGWAVDTLETAAPVEPRPGAPGLGRDGPADGLAAEGEKRPRLHAPLARLPRRLEPLHDVPLPPRRRPRREPRPLAARSRRRRRTRSSRGAGRSATSTASGRTTRRGSRPRRGSSASGRSAASSAPSTPTVS